MWIAVMHDGSDADVEDLGERLTRKLASVLFPTACGADPKEEQEDVDIRPWVKPTGRNHRFNRPNV